MMDDLSARIADGLATRFVGQKLLYYPRLSSTMDAAREEARKGAAAGTVIVAGEQTGGRGRVNRVWLSPPGNIALSVILRPEISLLPYLIMLASLAVANTLETVTGLKPQIKWPNDILINGKKVCGILIENELKGDRVDHSIIGIGINVGLRLPDNPEIRDIATSLSSELGKEVSMAEVIRRLLEEMEHLYLTFIDGDNVYQTWRKRLITLGRRVYAISGESRVEGIAEDVDKSGALLLRLEDGSLMRFIAGDVMVREK